DIFNKLNHLLLNYRRFDGLINIGGSIFMEKPGWREKFKSREILPKRLAKLNKSLFIIGANFGPYTEQGFFDSHNDFFAHFDDICFRNQYSYNYFNRRDNVRLAPDVVFNLKPNNVAKERSVGFSLINLRERTKLSTYYQVYNTKMIAMIENYM